MLSIKNTDNMIVREFYKTREDGISLYRTYSDKGFLILKANTNEKYLDAIDVEDAPFEYVETDELIELEIVE